MYHTPQSQPPLQAQEVIEGDSQIGLPHGDVAIPRQILPLSPTQDDILARAAAGIGGGSFDTTGNNFIKYGCIRPPVSVIQDEFLEKYSVWKEHAAPLKGIDSGGAARASSQIDDGASVICASYMEKVHDMHARYHHQQPDSFGRRPLSMDKGSREKSNETSDCAHYEQKCDEDEQKSAGNEISTGTGAVEGEISVSESKQLENLAGLMFRPGATLAGSIHNQHGNSSIHSPYELVMIEVDEMDETGRRLCGMLARHKFAGEEQCVFVKLSFVPIPNAGNTSPEQTEEDEESDSIEEEIASTEDRVDGGESGSRSDGVDSMLGSLPSEEEKLTIQMEYFDGDNRFSCLWNHETLRFEGSFQKVIEGQRDQAQIEGIITSSFILGHNRHNDGNSDDDDMESLRRTTPISFSQTRTFMLSPCSHLHPHGIAQDADPRCFSPEKKSRHAHTGKTTVRTTTSEGGYNDNTQSNTEEEPLADSDFAVSLFSKKGISRTIRTLKKHKILLDELASNDNYKLVLHRARTERLRSETLTKLVELGCVIDFAELARKRNTAERRELWRGRVRRYTPIVPLMRLLERCLTTPADNCNLSKNEKKQKVVKFYDQLANISWGDLLEEASIQAEKTCANFRRQTFLLDNLTFTSDEYKAQLMTDLRVNGLTLATAHSEWDTCIQNGRVVALGWSWFERGSFTCFQRSAVVGKRCVYLLFQMHARLESSHKNLEKAYRAADARLTYADLERIRATGEGSNDSSDKLCGICQCSVEYEVESGKEIDEKDRNHVTCLPCGHWFHWQCICEWLHNNSQCPICRMDLHARDKPVEDSM